MAKGSSIVGSIALGGVLVALVMRATTLHSVNGAPLIYRVVSNVNDLDGVEGLAPPGRVVELWFKQRNFKEGNDDASDPFAWCGWKNGGDAVRIGIATADAKGVWRLSDLRHAGTTVMLFPPAPGADRCLGGLYTELLPRACEQPERDGPRRLDGHRDGSRVSVRSRHHPGAPHGRFLHRRGGHPAWLADRLLGQRQRQVPRAARREPGVRSAALLRLLAGEGVLRCVGPAAGGTRARGREPAGRRLWAARLVPHGNLARPPARAGAPGGRRGAACLV